MPGCVPSPLGENPINEVDDDCDGTIDEGPDFDIPLVHADVDGDGYGNEYVSQGAAWSWADGNYVFFAEGGWAFTPGDCIDNDPEIHPGALEVLDLKDNDCDGQTDEGLLP